MSIWEQKPLSELCTIEIGGTPTRNNPIYWDSENTGSNYWVSIADLKKREITEPAERITNLGIRHSNAKLCKKGTVLMSFKLTVGRVAIAGRDLYTNEAIAAFTSKNLDHEYLYYGLQHWNLLKNVDQAIKGITLNKSKLKKIEAHYPVDKKEQSKIAEVLSTIDRAITQTEALIAKHQRIKTGLMQDLLTRGIDEHGQLRDESTHKFKSTPLGMIPVEWEESNLGKIGHRITSGSRGWARYYSDSGAKFIRIGSLTREHVNLRYENLQYVQPPDSSETKRTVLETGDLLISITADLGIIGVVPHDLGEAYINQHIALVKLDKESFNPYFVGNLLSGFQAQKYFSNLNDSGAKAGLNLKTIAAFPVVFPKKEEQDRIAEIILKADKIIQAKKIERKKLLGIKTGLMQDLLSGEVSVTPLLEG